jgi:hypothetical protein
MNAKTVAEIQVLQIRFAEGKANAGNLSLRLAALEKDDAHEKWVFAMSKNNIHRFR